MQPLVPVRGAGEYDDCLAQELFFWSDGALRLPWFHLAACIKSKFKVRRRRSYITCDLASVSSKNVMTTMMCL